MTDHSKTIAAALMAARRDSIGLAAYPGPMPETLAEAYAIQDAALALDGRAVGGWKLGRVAPQFEEALGASRFAGPILAHEIVMAGDEAADMDASPSAPASVETLQARVQELEAENERLRLQVKTLQELLAEQG